MKTPRFLLALLPLALLAATPRHQAFGPLRFGMTGDAAALVVTQLMEQVYKQKHRNLDASDARNHFISTGAHPGRLAAKDSSLRIGIHHTADPLVSSVRVESENMDIKREANGIREAWEVFQDIGDSKFTRVGKKGTFPAEAQFTGNGAPAATIAPEVVTDTWEFEGIRIELLIRGAINTSSALVAETVVLRATEITPPATAAK